MNRLRISCGLFFGWLFILYNIERLYEPINLASFVYVLAAGVALPNVLFASYQRIPLLWQLAPVIMALLLGKWWMDYRLAGAYLPLTVTEAGALAMTVVLARQIGLSISELRVSLVSTLISRAQKPCKPFDSGQSDIYREVRRARAFGRPLTLMAISPSDASLELSLDRFSQQVQQEFVRAYIQARIAELLATETRDYDVITQDNGHFVALLTETDREAAAEFVENLKVACWERLGIDLRCGMSFFPDEEVTFVDLLERAKSNLAQLGAEADETDVTERASETVAHGSAGVATGSLTPCRREF